MPNFFKIRLLGSRGVAAIEPSRLNKTTNKTTRH